MLAAKIDKAKFDALSDDLKKEYKLQGDGSYLLDVNPVDGFALENTEGLRTALSKERTNREAAERKLDAFKDLDPVKAKEAIGKVAEMANWKPEDKIREQIAAVTQQLADKHTGEKTKLEERLTKLTRQLEKVLIDAEAATAIAEQKGSATLLLPHVRATSRMRQTDTGEFVVEILDDKGNVRLSPKPGSTAPMTIAELVGSMKTQTDFAQAFAGSGASGSGASGGGSGGGAGGTGQHTISAVDAKDVNKYRVAKEAAEKAHVQLVILDEPKT